MSTSSFFYSPDPLVRWIHMRLDPTSDSSDYLMADEIWRKVLSEMGLPANSTRVHRRSRQGFLNLVRITHGLRPQKVRRVGKIVGGSYEYLRWSDGAVISDDGRIEIIID